MKRTVIIPLLMLVIGVWAFTSPDADPRAKTAAASIAPPLEGIDPRTGQRIPHPPPLPGELRTMSIKSLGNFSFDPAHPAIPPDVQRLTGLTVRLQGYMIASQEAGDRVTDFSLVPSLFACCYGQPPGVQHTIIVHCPPNHPATFTSGPVSVQGKLTVRIVRDDGYVVSLFELAAEKISPALGN